MLLEKKKCISAMILGENLQYSADKLKYCNKNKIDEAGDVWDFDVNDRSSKFCENLKGFLQSSVHEHCLLITTKTHLNTPYSNLSQLDLVL